MSHILIAEDERHIRDLIILTLQLHGFEVTPTKNGAEVLAKAEQKPYDLIMLDVRMPQMTGLEAAEQIRTQSANETTPILFLSGEDNLVDTPVPGAQILNKPFPLDILMGKINEMLGNGATNPTAV